MFDIWSGCGHFWYPKCAQMSPNGDPQMHLHNDVAKNRFWVSICLIFDPFNTRRWAFRLGAVLIFTFSSDRHFSPSKAGKVSKSASKWSSKSDKMSLKRHPKYMFCSLLFLTRCLIKNEPKNGAQNGPGHPFFSVIFHMWSQTSPLVPLWSTFGSFWVPRGSILASFCPLFGAPKASILVPTAFVLEFIDNLFLEQNTSHTDSGTWYPRPMF